MSNTFGTLFRVTTFGESHGSAIGGIIDGCPAGVQINEILIQQALKQRRPGQSVYTTARNEEDKIEFLSGIFKDKTLGTPIGFIIPNKDAQHKDYDLFQHVFRPSHADFTYSAKYGHRDHRGGGRSSARATAAIVAAGAIARQVIQQLSSKHNIKSPDVIVYVHQIGNVVAQNPIIQSQEEIYQQTLRCPDKNAEEKMQALILEAKQKGDSLGGIISGSIIGLPVGLGEPLFNKFQSALASAMFSINAVHGFDYGMGFDGACRNGSEVNDEFILQDNRVVTKTNYSGGIQGGITNGMPVDFRVAFKPTSTIYKAQQTLNESLENIEIQTAGRHDPCVLPRAVSIVEAFCWLVILDMMLLNQHARI